MPFLRVEQGSCPGQILEVAGERVVIGRHPSCEIVLDNAAVSRQHAQISESHGGYFLEDLRSRNRTFLNGAPIEGAAELKDRDTIQVCDLTFRFFLDPPPAEDESTTATLPSDLAATPPLALQAIPLGGDGAAGDGVPPGGHSHLESGSSILSTMALGEGSGLLLGVRPEQKLRAVLDIGRTLANALDLDTVLGKTLDGLFRVFPQADHGFVLLKDPEKPKLVVRAMKSRRVGETTARVSMTVVRRAMKTGEAILSADVIADDRFAASESLPSMEIRSVVCVPLLSQTGEPFGVVQLDGGDADRSFSKDDLDLLASVAGQIGLAVENARLHAELVSQRDMRRELDFAMQVQLGFLPGSPPEPPGYEFFDHYEAAYRVGGDYFDYVELPDGRIAVAVGDVAGKGVPAALLMARLFSSARYQLLARRGPGEALASLNSEIARTALGHRFITCLFAVLDPREHTLVVANAGHMAPLVRSADGTVEPLGQKDSGLPIGIARDQTFAEVTRPLAPGDLVLMYTDGVTEAMSPDADLYGRDRLRRRLSAFTGPIREAVESIVADVARFSGGAPQRDDVCLVGFRRLPN